MKLESPEALAYEPPLDLPAEPVCYHPRRSVVLGLTVCHDCGELCEPMELPVIGQDEG
jgi:hypothetical protein